jgi:hypothetical protein
VTGDPLLAALADARHRKEQADKDIRLLLVYAREIAAPRPYRLVDLAHAAGMSISGVRTAYTSGDIQEVASLLAGSGENGEPPAGRWNIPASVATLLATGCHAQACEHIPPA